MPSDNIVIRAGCWREEDYTLGRTQEKHLMFRDTMIISLEKFQQYTSA